VDGPFIITGQITIERGGPGALTRLRREVARMPGLR
jgi:hypothetical protein